MMLICSLASGSKGNCTLVSDGRTHILVDVGISARRVTAALKSFDLQPGDISCVLVTHEHGDHIRGLKHLHLPVIAAPAVCDALEKDVSDLTEIAGPEFEVGSLGVTAFRTPHDTPESMGYLLHMGTGLRVAVCTDLGFMPEGALALLRSAQYLMLESNHDVRMLREGSYPAFLKQRILSRRGHLSNAAAADAIADCARHGQLRRVTLCHLSEENNTPDLALAAVSERLLATGAVPGRDILLDVAPPGYAGAPCTSLAC